MLFVCVYVGGGGGGVQVHARACASASLRPSVHVYLLDCVRVTLYVCMRK